MIDIMVPATSANLGPGFDSLGIAVKIYNKFSFKNEGSVFKTKIKNIDTGQIINLTKEDNLVYKTMKYVFDLYNQKLPGIILNEEVQVPFARGLGSSATAVVAGVTAANYFLGDKLTCEDIIKLAVKIEGHPDNIIPAVVGGFVINIIQDDRPLYKKIKLDPGLKMVIVIPDFRLRTEKVREVLPENIKYKDAVFNHSRTAMLTAALYDKDYTLLKSAMSDKIHQDYRADLIPGFYDVIESAYKKGALGAALSGAGPSILTFCTDNYAKIGQTMVETFKSNNIDSKYIITEIDNNGLQLVKEGE
ncbi:MAG: homoserine kinase [Halothermotrichaceae bacterium]